MLHKIEIGVSVPIDPIGSTPELIIGLRKNLISSLAELDENEFIFDDNNATSKLIMVCGRDQKERPLESDANEIESNNVNKRMFNLANSYLENLRQEAHIVFK